MKIKALIISAAIIATQAAQAATFSKFYLNSKTHDQLWLSAIAENAAAQEIKEQAFSTLLPNIKLGLANSLNQTNNDTIDSHSASITLQQALYNSALFAADNKAKKIASKADLILQKAKNDLLIRAANAYFNALYAQDALNFAQAENTSLKTQLEQEKRKLEVGVANITDVLEVQARFDASEARLISAQDNVHSAMDEIEIMVPDFDGQLNSLKHNVFDSPIEDINTDFQIEIAKKNNLDILIAQDDLIMAENDVQIDESGHLPTINLLGKSQAQQIDGLSANDHSISLNMEMPLYSGGMVSSKVKAAKLRKVAAGKKLKHIERQTVKAVKDSIRRINSSFNKIKALKSAVASAEQMRNSIALGITVGTRTLSDLLDSESTVLKSKENLARAMYDHIIILINFENANGQLQEDIIYSIDELLEENKNEKI